MVNRVRLPWRDGSSSVRPEVVHVGDFLAAVVANVVVILLQKLVVAVGRALRPTRA